MTCISVNFFWKLEGVDNRERQEDDIKDELEHVVLPVVHIFDDGVNEISKLSNERIVHNQVYRKKEQKLRNIHIKPPVFNFISSTFFPLAWVIFVGENKKIKTD